MPAIVSAFAAGLLFSLGLIVSQMVDPQKVLSFLDVFGNWDPSLAFVMGGAVIISAIGYRLARLRGRPVLAPKLEVPSRQSVEPRLVAGSALFGIGWGLVGLCPGPAVTALAFAPAQILVFVGSMVAGMALFRLMPAATGAPSMADT